MLPRHLYFESPRPLVSGLFCAYSEGANDGSVSGIFVSVSGIFCASSEGTNEGSVSTNTVPV